MGVLMKCENCSALSDWTLPDISPDEAAQLRQPENDEEGWYICPKCKYKNRVLRKKLLDLPPLP